MVFGEWKIEPHNHIALNTQSFETVDLTPTEMRYLKLFLDNPRKLFTFQGLMEEAQGKKHGSQAAVRTFIKRLRKKVPCARLLIVSRHGLGYEYRP